VFERVDGGVPVPKGDDAQARLGEIEVEGRAIASQITQLQARLVELAAETDKLSGHVIDIGTRDYLAWQWGMEPKEAGRLCRLARHLPRLDQIAEAFQTGQISEGVTTLLVGVATPENQQALLRTTQVATGAQLHRLVADFRSVRPGPVTRDEYHRTRVEADGMVSGSYRLSTDNGATHMAALRAARELVSDDANQPVTDPSDIDDVVAAREVEVFMCLAESFLDGTLTKAGVLPERFSTSIVIEHSDPVDDTTPESSRTAHVHGVGTVAMSSVESLLCESTISVILKRHGVAVNVSSPTRLATAEQSRALWERDRGCQFPGCGRHTRLIAHHVTFYDLGGPTHLSNMILLCRRCHRRVHRPGWRIDLSDHGRVKRFYRPDGKLVAPACTRPARGDPDLAELPGATQPNHGTGERLTYYARDVLITEWLQHTPTPTTLEPIQT